MKFQECLNMFLLMRKDMPTAGDYERLVDQHFRQWQEWPTPAQIEDWHSLASRRPHQATQGLAFLRTFFYWAIRRGAYAGANPALGIRRHKTYSRERVMNSQEVATMIACLDMMPPKMAALLMVMLMTGARLSEVRVMKREHVNFQTGEWVQPKTKTKPHTTYLPHQARHLLSTIPDKTNDYFFSGFYGQPYSRPAAEKQWRQIRLAVGLRDVRLHDFRRTLATHLFRAEKNEMLVKRCINHVNSSVTAIYVRISWDEVAKALQSQANRFFALKGDAQIGGCHAQYALNQPALIHHVGGFQ